MNHIHQNIKDKLRSLHIPQGVMNNFLDDIFGKNFEAGLVDADSETAFRAALGRLKCQWNNLERGCSSGSTGPEFHSWFCKFKAEEIIKSALPSVRVRAGADPDRLFTTNSSESINHVIKAEVEWKESKLPCLISHLNKLAMQHQAEIEKAIIGRGEWCFCSQYASLQVPESTWFCGMNLDEKQKHLKKVLKTQVVPVNLRTREPNQSSVQEHCDGLSVPVETAIAKLPPVSSSTLSCMWSKAADLIRAKDHVLNVPWLPDPKARLVKSSSSAQPHVVTTKEGGIYVCDSNCPMFKGFSLCSHVVAAAEVNGDLSHFLDAINKHCTPNL